MERAKFRWLYFALLLTLSAATLSAAQAGERRRDWIDPPSDLLTEAQGDWSDASGTPGEAGVPAKPGDPASETGSVALPVAAAGTLVKAPDGRGGPESGERSPGAGSAEDRNAAKTASREDPPAVEPPAVRRSSIDRGRTRARTSHVARRTHHRMRQSHSRSSVFEKVFGPPRRNANVISTGSFR
jgi:hypothetical protein